jgi:hypothetical protein
MCQVTDACMPSGRMIVGINPPPGVVAVCKCGDGPIQNITLPEDGETRAKVHPCHCLLTIDEVQKIIVEQT